MMAVDVNIVRVFGPMPDGIDLTENRAKHMDEGNIALIVLALLAVVLRFWARFVQQAGFKADDYLVALALVFSVATCILTTQLFNMGAGRHVWALSADQVSSVSKILYALLLTYALAVFTLKTSIVFLYIRLFPLNDLAFRWALYLAGFLGSTMCIVSLVLVNLSCRPISFLWTRFYDDSTGKCMDIPQLFMGLACVNVFIDFFLLAIPIPRIARLQVAMRKKVIVITSMLLGIFVCMAGLTRIYYLVKFNATDDFTAALAPVCIWLAMEPAIGIVTTCLPNMLPLYHWACEKMGLRSSASSTRHHISTGKRAGIGGYRNSQRLPTYIENNMVLRPKEDDEICLTTLATAARNVSNESVEVNGHGILVRSEVTQVIEMERSNNFRS